MKQKKVIKTATELGVKLKVGKKPTGKILFPEKLAKANDMLSRLKNKLPA